METSFREDFGKFAFTKTDTRGEVGFQRTTGKGTEGRVSIDNVTRDIFAEIRQIETEKLQGKWQDSKVNQDFFKAAHSFLTSVDFRTLHPDTKDLMGQINEYLKNNWDAVLSPRPQHSEMATESEAAHERRLADFRTEGHVEQQCNYHLSIHLGSYDLTKLHTKSSSELTKGLEGIKQNKETWKKQQEIDLKKGDGSHAEKMGWSIAGAERAEKLIEGLMKKTKAAEGEQKAFLEKHFGTKDLRKIPSEDVDMPDKKQLKQILSEASDLELSFRSNRESLKADKMREVIKKFEPILKEMEETEEAQSREDTKKLAIREKYKDPILMKYAKTTDLEHIRNLPGGEKIRILDNLLKDRDELQASAKRASGRGEAELAQAREEQAIALHEVAEYLTREKRVL
jgi:hypothetical protein